jgi:hypothetical protein
MFFYLTAVILFSRLYPLFSDGPLAFPKLITMMLIQLLLLLFLSLTPEFFIFLTVLFILDILNYWLEKKIIKYNFIRFILFSAFFIISIIFSSNYIGLSFNIGILNGFQNFIEKINPFSGFSITWYHLIVILSGLLFILNEVNFLIRLLFELSGKIPVDKETDKLDRKEFNAGKIIGILERIFIFFFIIAGQFTAVGFVIAAKGILRYKELEDRSFAEYVLIGTLLSSLLAMFTGFITAHLIM